MNDIERLKWESVVGECRIHEGRLHVAMLRMAEWLPLDGSKIDNMGDEDTAWQDQFLYRFAKLQDAMGERMFVDGLLLLGEDFRDRPFIDVLNRLESLRLIPSRAWWQELREFRNQVAHEYPDRREEQASACNAIYERCSQLLQELGEFVRTVENKVSEASL